MGLIRLESIQYRREFLRSNPYVTKEQPVVNITVPQNHIYTLHYNITPKNALDCRPHTKVNIYIFKWIGIGASLL